MDGIVAKAKDSVGKSKYWKVGRVAYDTDLLNLLGQPTCVQIAYFPRSNEIFGVVPKYKRKDVLYHG